MENNNTEKKVVWYIWVDRNGVELDRKVKGRGRQFKEAVLRADGNWYIVENEQFSSHSLAVQTVAANFVATLGFSDLSLSNVDFADSSIPSEDSFNMYDEMHFDLPENSKNLDIIHVN